jgi:hypothetical protein
VHGRSLNIPLASYFADDDEDIFTMIATCKLSGGAAVTIPNGIFNMTSPFTIEVASTSITDTGVYTITLAVSDPLSASVTQTFIVNVTNAAPRVTNSPLSHSIVHGNYISMPLAGYFIDDDGDSMTMSSTYSLNGGSPQPIPGGIFTIPSPFTIYAKSVGFSDVGTYKI